jgi:hypothetical protein
VLRGTRSTGGVGGVFACERDAALTHDLLNEGSGADRNVPGVAGRRQRQGGIGTHGLPRPYELFGWCDGCKDGSVCQQVLASVALVAEAGHGLALARAYHRPPVLPAGAPRQRALWWCDHCGVLNTPLWLSGLDTSGVQVVLCEPCGRHFAARRARRGVPFAPGPPVAAAMRVTRLLVEAVEGGGTGAPPAVWPGVAAGARGQLLPGGRVAVVRDGVLVGGKRARDRLARLRRAPRDGLARLQGLANVANLVGSGVYWTMGATSRPFDAVPLPALSAVAAGARAPWGATGGGGSAALWQDVVPPSPGQPWRSSLPFFPGEEDDGGEAGVWASGPASHVCVCPAWALACTCGARTPSAGSVASSAAAAAAAGGESEGPLPGLSRLWLPVPDVKPQCGRVAGCILLSVSREGLAEVAPANRAAAASTTGGTCGRSEDGGGTSGGGTGHGSEAECVRDPSAGAGEPGAASAAPPSRRFPVHRVADGRQASHHRQYQYWRSHVAGASAAGGEE